MEIETHYCLALLDWTFPWFWLHQDGSCRRGYCLHRKVERRCTYSRPVPFVVYAHHLTLVQTQELDGRRIRVDYSVTDRPHAPTPGEYMGTRRDDGGRRGFGRYERYDRYDRDREYRGDRRSDRDRDPYGRDDRGYRGDWRDRLARSAIAGVDPSSPTFFNLGTVSGETGGLLLAAVAAGTVPAPRLAVVAATLAVRLATSAMTWRQIPVPPAGDLGTTSSPRCFRIPCVPFFVLGLFKSRPLDLNIVSWIRENTQFLRRHFIILQKPHKRKRRSSTLTYSSSALFVTIPYFCTSLQLRPGCPSYQECPIQDRFRALSLCKC